MSAAQSPAKSIHIRPAVASDAPAIRRIVRAAHLNPLDLNWRRFVVAEDAGAIVGVGQIRRHGDGSRELASLAVVPGRRGQGLGTTIVRALLDREPGPLFLYCAGDLAGFYARFGFRTVGRVDMAPYLRRVATVARLIGRLARLVRREPPRLAIMKRP